VGGAGYAGIIPPYQHAQPEFYALRIHSGQLGLHGVHVLLDIAVVLVGGNDTVRRYYPAILAVLIAVKENAAGHFYSAHTPGRSHPDPDRPFLMQFFPEQPGNDLQGVLCGMNTFHQLSQCIQVWVVHRRSEAQLPGRLFCSLGEQLVIDVESGQGPNQVGFPEVSGPFGSGPGNAIFVGYLLIQ